MAAPSAPRAPLEVWVVTGQSGSGKSTALRALEDHGYYCVDNLPRGLVEQLVAYLEGDVHVRRLALGLDVREAGVGGQAPALIERLRRRPGGCRVLFLQASVAATLRRYTTTRRWHPLDDGRGLRAAIEAEAACLGPLAEVADEVLDTSELTPHDLRALVAAGHQDSDETGVGLRVGVVSFGFKYGVPAESNLLFDVRFLPNPYFDPVLRPQSGLDKPVRDAVLSAQGARPWLAHTLTMLDFALPLYRQEGKRYLHVTIGCTGGRHRSVALTCALAEALEARGWPTFVRHRDIQQEG